MDQFKASEELEKANEQIAQQVIDLQAQRIALDEGAAAAFRFSAQHGELAKTLDLATDSQAEFNDAVEERANLLGNVELQTAITTIDGLVRSTEEATQAIIENAIAEEQGAVAAIRYAIAQGRLKDTFEDLGPAAAEWQKKLEDAAAAQEVLTQRQAEDAASEAIIPSRTKALEEYNNALAGLQRRLDATDISQKDFEQGVKIAKENFEEATKAIDEMSVFAEEAARNMQDAFADFLFDPFSGGLENMLSGFADTLRRMSAELIASKLFEQFNAADLFKGGGIFGKLGDIFGGGGGGVPVGATPGINPYEPFPTIGAMGGGAAAGTAATTAAATTTAATTFATAITTAGTAAATAFTAAGTTAATALTAAGTTVAASITTAGASAAAAIAAAGTAGAATKGLETLVSGFDFSGIGFAKGGSITGPGTGTSDSIPARLSAGEFVVKAEAVRVPGVQALLERINDGSLFRGFAAGGLVRPYAAPQGTPALPLYLADGGLVERVAGPTGGREPTVVQQSITINAPQGQVSRATEMQLTAAAARGARQADRHNN